MSVRIVVDSTADIEPRFQALMEVVPTTVRFGDQEFIDGVTIDSQTFYQKLETCKELPTTSQVTPYQFSQVFEKAVQQGDSVVCVTISGTMSGTCQSARMAAQEYPGQVFVVDSRNVAVGTGVLAEYAVQLAQQGLAAEQICEILCRERENVQVLALLGTLEFLKRGGRISKAVAFTGGLLNIKPVVSMEQGQIKMLGKARGNNQGNAMLNREIEKAGGVDFEKPLLLGYTGVGDDRLRQYLAQSEAVWGRDVPVASVGSAVGTHVGPDTIAVAFFTKGNTQFQ